MGYALFVEWILYQYGLGTVLTGVDSPCIEFLSRDLSFSIWSWPQCIAGVKLFQQVNELSCPWNMTIFGIFSSCCRVHLAVSPWSMHTWTCLCSRSWAIFEWTAATYFCQLSIDSSTFCRLSWPRQRPFFAKIALDMNLRTGLVVEFSMAIMFAKTATHLSKLKNTLRYAWRTLCKGSSS